MADSHHIIDGQVVPFSGGHKSHDTDSWRDATPLELQLQEELQQSEQEIDTLRAQLEAAEADAQRWRALVSEPTSFVSAKGWQWASGDPDYTPIESRVDDMIARTKEETK